MINFVYKDEEEKIIIGIVVSNDVKSIIPIVPEGIYFYTYNDGDNINNVLNGTPAGIGAGKKIN